jgi:hypothetical protein
MGEIAMKAFTKAVTVISIFTAILVNTSQAIPANETRVAIVVDPDIYVSIRRELNDYGTFIQKKGHVTVIESRKWNDAFELRSWLLKEYQKGLVGAVLIGNIPIPHFHRDKDCEPRPCVLSLMDLNGHWDKDATGSHYIHEPGIPDIFPEIWVSVIMPNCTKKKPELLLRRYFKKLQRFRTKSCNSSKPVKALSFIEHERNCKFFTTLGLEVLYKDNVTVLRNPKDTSPGRLFSELRKDYQFITLEGHNNGGFTGMTISDSRGRRDDLGEKEILGCRPKAAFYHVYSCSVCCPTKKGYLAGILLFSTPAGVLLHGTTMVGGMNCPEVLYKEWLSCGSFGEAFKKWYVHEIPRDAKATKRRWYLGAIIMGDPLIEFPESKTK